MMIQPTIILLHGAGTGTWVWERVIDKLSVPAHALDVPCRKPGVTPDSCAKELINDINKLGISSIILVMHSLSGVLAGEISKGLGSRLLSCVYVSGVVPPPNGTFVDALQFPNQVILHLLFKFNRNGLKPSSTMIRRELCNDLSEEDTEMVVKRYEAEFPGLYLKPVDEKTVLPPTTYIKLLKDQSITPKLQDSMIARLDRPRVVKINSGHLAMLSVPEELSTIINQEILLD